MKSRGTRIQAFSREEFPDYIWFFTEEDTLKQKKRVEVDNNWNNLTLTSTSTGVEVEYIPPPSEKDEIGMPDLEERLKPEPF